MSAITSPDPLTVDSLVAHGWARCEALLLITNPERLIATLVNEQGWSDADARVRVGNPLLNFDVIIGDDSTAISLEDAAARDR